MSTVLTIKRLDAGPLSRTTMEHALSKRPQFARSESGHWRLFDSASGTDLFLNLEEDQLWTDGNPAWLENPALEELRLLAATLGARVLGEEDEDVTDVAPAEAEATSRGASRFAAVMGGLFAVLLAPLLVIFAVVRIPWVLLQIARQK